MCTSKKILCKYLTVLLICIFLFAGCGGTAANVENKPQLTEVKIKWVTALPIVDSDREAVFNEVNRIIKEKINATIEFNILSSDQWKDKIPVLLMSGEPMDIVWHNWMFSYAANVSRGFYRAGHTPVKMSYRRGCLKIINLIKRQPLFLCRINDAAFLHYSCSSTCLCTVSISLSIPAASSIARNCGRYTSGSYTPVCSPRPISSQAV